jgi:predicted ATPase
MWDVDRIRAKGYTDNVVDLMVGKLNRFPETTQDSLKQLACLGNSAKVAVLSMVCGESEERLDAALWEAIGAGLVSRTDDTYTFVHDRVQEAAYALIPEGERATVHLHIGRALTSRMGAAEIEENIFEIVNQLNRSSPLSASQEELDRLAELNLMAARRARSSTAYASALVYLSAAVALLSADSWERSYAFTFALKLQQSRMRTDQRQFRDRRTNHRRAAAESDNQSGFRSGLSTEDRAAYHSVRKRSRGGERAGGPPTLWSSDVTAS